MAAKANSATTIAERALSLVEDGMIVGLGTGRAASAFIEALGQRVRAGLNVRGIPTSQASAELAVKVGIPLAEFDAGQSIDVTFDGADEVDPEGNAIKGYGGALVREKIVAAASSTFVVLIGEEKLVPVLGSRGRVPVEVVTFGVPATMRHISALGLTPQIRTAGDRPLVTDNGNWILDCLTGPIGKPAELEPALRAIPGVVGTGLFLGMADRVLIQRPEQVEERVSREPDGTL